MNHIVDLNGKLACAECGEPANINDTKCSRCNRVFSERVKTMGRTHGRNYNPTLTIGSFISVEKLREIGKISIMH